MALLVVEGDDERGVTGQAVEYRGADEAAALELGDKAPREVTVRTQKRLEGHMGHDDRSRFPSGRSPGLQTPEADQGQAHALIVGELGLLVRHGLGPGLERGLELDVVSGGELCDHGRGPVVAAQRWAIWTHGLALAPRRGPAPGQLGEIAHADPLGDFSPFGVVFGTGHVDEDADLVETQATRREGGCERGQVEEALAHVGQGTTRGG